MPPWLVLPGQCLPAANHENTAHGVTPAPWSGLYAGGCRLSKAALAAPDSRLSEDERYELEHSHTLCDVINDDTAGKRITHESRAARGFFTVDNLETRNIA